MSNKQEIIDYLIRFSVDNPEVVRNKLTRGMRIKKNLSQSYVIDDVNLDEGLGRFPIGAIPYGPVHNTLKSNGSELRTIFGENSSIPFSKVVKSGVGQCLEKSILIQMATQRAGNSYLVSGALELDEEVGAEFHAFNLVSRGESVYLVDVENPFNVDKGGWVVSPYVVPINEITSNGTIIVPTELRAGRTYCLD